jgi:hypothetical protein
VKRFLWLFLFFLLAAGCGGGSSNSLSFNGGSPNLIPVSVSSGVCNGAPNSACVKVTICDPNLVICQTIPDILVDTGSSGLRVFKSALAPSLQSALARYPVIYQGNQVAECLPFADLTVAWGAVQFAGVVLGTEPAVKVPIQVIDSTFGSASACQSASGGSSVILLQNPAAAGSNGILGLDLFQYDMGNYYCGSTTCNTLPGLPLAGLVQNPVFLLPVDYNGIILTFPNIPSSGAASLTGLLTLGIGTRSNNQVAGNLTTYPYLPANATTFALTTSYNGTLYPQSYIDSGTNGFVVPDPSNSIPLCTSGFFCPASTLALVASNQDIQGNLQPVFFQIANADNLFKGGTFIFNNLGFPPGGSTRFIWGVPFFLGKTIYFAYDLSPTPLGTGPFWAY